MTAMTSPSRPMRAILAPPTAFERMLLAASEWLDRIARRGMARRQAQALRALKSEPSLTDRLAPLTAYDQLHIR